MQKPEITQRKVDNCSQCGSISLIHDYDAGETVCSDCGLVATEPVISMGPEWRAFTPEQKASRTRVGMPASYVMFDKGLSTTIGRVDRDASGRRLPWSTRLKMWRLRKWQIRSRVHSSFERNLAQAMTELNRLSDKLSIHSQIRENAAVIYRKALEKGLVQGRSIAGIMAASLYAACRKSETPRMLREVAEASLVDKKEVSRCYRLLLRELEIHMPPDDPVTYISQIGAKAGISIPIQGIALDILREARQKRLTSGKDPGGLAAATLYLACLQVNEKKTQKDIAKAADVTEVTVRNRYKALQRQLALRTPD